MKESEFWTARSLSPGPFDTVKATDALVRELRESGGGEIEVRFFATRASVGDGDGDALALVCGIDLLVTDGVVVGVGTGVARVLVVQNLRDSDDVIGVGVRDAA